MTGIIYKYTSPSGKIYIGQTANEKQRIYQHHCHSKTYKTHFYTAVRKYGWEQMKYEVILSFRSDDVSRMKIILDTLERHYIRKYKSNNRQYGYNQTGGGLGTLGRIPWMKGKHHTAESKQMNREKHIGKVSKKRIPIVQMDKDHNVIATYDWVGDAIQHLFGDISNFHGKQCALRRACIEPNKTLYGYVWKYLK